MGKRSAVVELLLGMGARRCRLNGVGPEQEDLRNFEAWRNRPVESEHG